MCGISMLSTNSIIIWCYQPQHIHPRITITYISEHIKPTQEFNRVFTYIPTRLRVIIPKPIVAEFNLAIIVLSLILERTPEILFSKTLTGVAVEVLFAFPYQLTFLVVGSLLVHSVQSTVNNGDIPSIYPALSLCILCL